MISERMHNWLALGANIGVIVGLLLLAFEINQSTKATIAAASEGLTEQSLVFMAARLDNSIVARASYKQDYDQDLDEFEEHQLVLLQQLNFRLFESAYLQYRRGLYDESEWDRYSRIIANLMRDNETARIMWTRTEGGWTAEFEEEVERIRSADSDERP